MKCHQSFSNVWEMNKHQKTHCLGPDSLAEEVTTQPGMDPPMKNWQRFEMRPNTSENSVEYIVGEDDGDFDIKNPLQTDDSADESSSTDTGEEEEADPRRRGDAQSNDDSSSTDHSSDSSSGLPSKENPSALARKESSFCSACGRGPFRSVKLHLLHCTGVRIEHVCTRCKAQFPTAQSLKIHYFYLYSCDNCGQVFSNKSSSNHSCGKSSPLSVVNFCSESMPKVCSICKAFFIHEKALLNHVNRIHTSLVRTKLCIIPNSVPTGKVPQGDIAIGPGRVLVSSMTVCQNPSAVKQVVNGKLPAPQTYAGVLPDVKSSPLPFMTPSFHNGTPPAPAAAVRPGKDRPTDPAETAPAPKAVLPQVPTILAMFQNDSQEVALMRRMNMGWRSKAAHPCRECGAVLRQPSLAISHRYLHRGHRAHRCQCGRAFKHRLHLLRHCLEHAEAVDYICVSCGESFTGTKLIAEHLRGKSQKKPTRKRHIKKACRTPLACDCGQLFSRPSAYIWHQLQNKLASKKLKKRRK